jgi:hypothetical protein
MMNPDSDRHNRIELKSSFPDFRDPRLTFSVSSRKIYPDIDIVDYLRVFYIYCNQRQIESVFGNTTVFSRLYGGRLPSQHYDLSKQQVRRLVENGIHLALTLTNHFFDEAAYKESWPLLEEHHRKGNSIICTNDRLARHLKRDFPLYELKASIIKNIDTLAKVKRALEIYQALTLPMDKNDDDEFLNSLPEKERIILFANANCAYTCPARTCYLGFSQEIFGKPVTSVCSKDRIPRLDMGHVFFDVRKLAGMGFTRFKLVPLAPHGSIQVCRKLSWKKGYFIDPIKKIKAVHYLCSYPKCGRTWLRFILAHYLNRLYNLGLDIDLHTFFTLMPTDDRTPESGITAYRFASDPRFPLFLASHNSYSKKRFGTDADSRLVFLLRSVPDVVVSEYFHRSRFMKVLQGGLKEFIRSPEGGLARYCRYLNSWAPIVQSGGSLVLTYEMLHRDTGKNVADVLTFMEIPVAAGILRESVSLSTFHAMQSIEKKRGIPRFQASPDDPESQRVRRGKVGGSREYLDPEDLDYMRQTSESLLTDAARALLRRFHLWPIPECGTAEKPQ